MNLESVFESYVRTALWSSTDDYGNPLDEKYTKESIHKGTLENMTRDCKSFLDKNKIVIESVDPFRFEGSVEGMIGHDFWLTRNGHGAGFWDGDWPTMVGKELTIESKKFGEFNLYIGDDGMIHGC
jgi:hypothetical protein